MKKVFRYLLFFAVLFPFKASAQNKNYTMLKDSTAWCYVYENNYSKIFTYHGYMVDGDTVIDNKSYKNIYKYSGEYDRQKATYVGSMREDGNRVYCAGKYNIPYFDLDFINNETLLYDFSINIGDNFALEKESGEPCVITMIEEIKMPDGYHKSYQLNDLLFGYWLEGVGSYWDNPFTPCRKPSTRMDFTYLIKFVQGKNTLLGIPDFTYMNDGVRWLERTSRKSVEDYILTEYLVKGDTIINKLLYKKVYANNKYHGAIRMNIEQKIYYLKEDMKEDILLYDFHWLSEKEICSKNYKGSEFVLITSDGMGKSDDMSMTLLDNKLYYYRPLSSNPNPAGSPFSTLNKNIRLIKYLGLTSGIFSHVETKRNDENVFNDLVCLYNGDKLIYLNPAFNENGELSSGIIMANKTKHLQVSVSGNEVTFILKEDQNLTGVKLYVYGIDGKQLSVNSMDAGLITLTGIPNGVYYYRLDTTNGNNENGKFIVSD